MIPVAGHDNHFSRCVRFNEIDWSALPEGTKREEGAGHARRADAADRRPQEILQGRRQRDLRRRRRPRRQGQRDDQLHGARIRDGGDRRRIRLRQVDARQGAARPRDGDAPAPSRSATRTSSRPASRCATCRPCRRSRWCSRIRSTRSTRAIPSARRSSARWRSSASATPSPTGASACSNCSTSSSCRAPSRRACRASCPAARSSASAWRAPSPATPRWWWPTSRSRRSTCRCRRRSPNS